jgi:hypothetical protein
VSHLVIVMTAYYSPSTSKQSIGELGLHDSRNLINSSVPQWEEGKSVPTLIMTAHKEWAI